MNKNIQFMRRAAKIAAKTKCWIGLGCVIARKDEVLSEGFNQTLSGEEFCQKYRDENKKNGNQGCIRHELKLSRGREVEKVCSIHAEASAIAFAAKKGISLNKSTIYVTSFPCLVCLRLIIAAGIIKIFYMNDFYHPHHLGMLKKNRIIVEQINEKDVWKIRRHPDPEPVEGEGSSDPDFRSGERYK